MSTAAGTRVGPDAFLNIFILEGNTGLTDIAAGTRVYHNTIPDKSGRVDVAYIQLC